MRDPIRKSLRKWVVGVGCTLSVALLFNNVKNSDAFQGAVQSITNGNDSSSVQQDGSSSAQDPVIQEWQDQQSQDSSNDSGSITDNGSSSSGSSSGDSGTFSDNGSSGFGNGFGGGSSGGGFRSRSGHS